MPLISSRFDVCVLNDPSKFINSLSILLYAKFFGMTCQHRVLLKVVVPADIAMLEQIVSHILILECTGTFGQNLWCLLPPSLVFTIWLHGIVEDAWIEGEMWIRVQISTCLLVALFCGSMAWIWANKSFTVHLSAIWHKCCYQQDIKYADWSKNVTPFWPAVMASALSFRGLIKLATSGNWW